MPYAYQSRSYDNDGALQVLPRPSGGIPQSQTELIDGWARDGLSGFSYIEVVGASVPQSSVKTKWGRVTTDGALCVTPETTPVSSDWIHQSMRYRNDGALYIQTNGTVNSTTDQQTGLGRLTRTGALYIDSLSFMVDFTDNGAGVANIVPKLGGVAGTFTRATAAASKLSTGLWKLDVASGSPRFTYSGLDTTVTTTGGYFAEGARTNSVLQARDLTNAAWTKSNLTTAQTSTGIDGVTNSCTRCTASAGNGTALQAVVIASAAKAFGVWIKRITGTGEIDITLDNGSTWTNITSQINASTFTLVQATQTLANPTVGIRIVTSADAIDVDVAQLEDGAAFSSTPIPTTVAAVTRNADLLTYPTSPWFNALTGTVFASGQVYTTAGNSNRVLALTDTGPNERMNLNINTVPNFNWFVNDGGVSQADIGGGTPVVNTTFKAAACYAANDFAVAAGGAILGTDSAGTLPTVTTLYVGDIGTGGAGQVMWGTISRTAAFQRRLPDNVLQKITA